MLLSKAIVYWVGDTLACVGMATVVVAIIATGFAFVALGRILREKRLP